jgi:N-acetylmuramoyl-L-alanine amidase
MLDVKGANSHLILPEEPEGVLYLELDTHLTAAGQPESELGESDRLDVLLKGVLGNPVPPTSIGLKLFSEDGTTPSDIRFELNDVDGNLHQGVVDERGEAFVDGLTPGRCTVVLKDLAPSEWGAEPKAGGTSAAYTSKGEEDLPLIAVKNGYQSWRTLFDAKENAALREARPSPDHLAKDDGIQLPPKESEPVPVETGQVHMFRVETRPVEMLRLRIDSDTSFVYELTVAGSTVEGEGEPGDIIEHQVPPDATDADLLIYDQGADPKSGDKYKLKLGALEPVSTDRGVQARLTNLGFDTQGVDGNIGDKTKDAIEQFQLANGLEATREADEPTRARIEEKHDRAPPATSTAAEQVDSA